MADDRLYFRQLLSGRDFATTDPVARQMVNFAYLIGDRQDGSAVIVDPAYDIAGLLDILAADDMRCAGVLATHFHPDHVGGDLMGYRIEGVTDLLESVQVPVHVQRDEAQWVVRATGVSDAELVSHDSGDVVTVGDVRIELVHTPGHTPGSQCFVVDGKLVSGDTLFLDGCGRTDLPGGDPEQMYESLTTRWRASATTPCCTRGTSTPPSPRPPGRDAGAQLRLPAAHARAVDDDVRRLSPAPASFPHRRVVPPDARRRRHRGRRGRVPGRLARRRGAAGRGPRRRITLIGAEPHLPYDRPPLSKQFLAGKWDLTVCVLRRPDKLDELRLDSASAVAPVASTSRATPSSSTTATVPARRPGRGHGRPASRLCPAHRRAACTCCARWRTPSPWGQRCGEGTRLVVVGAGFIGSEVAATCRGPWCAVTVVEALPSPWRACSGGRWARRCGALHAPTGWALRTGVGWPGMVSEPRRRRVTGVASTTGRCSTPTSWWWASAWCPRRRGWRARGSSSPTGWWPTPPARRGRRGGGGRRGPVVRPGPSPGADRALDQRGGAGRGGGAQPAGGHGPTPSPTYPCPISGRTSTR